MGSRAQVRPTSQEGSREGQNDSNAGLPASFYPTPVSEDRSASRVQAGAGVFPAAGQGQCLGAQQHCLQPGLQGQRRRWAAGTGGDRGQSRGWSPGTSLMAGAEQGFSGQRLEGWGPPHRPTEPGGALLDLRSGLCLPSWQTPCLLWAPALSPVSEDSTFSGLSGEQSQAA